MGTIYFKTYKAAKNYADKHPTSKYMTKRYGGSRSGVGKVRGGAKKPWKVQTARRGIKTKS